LRNRSSILVRARDFSFRLGVKNGSGAHPAFCPMDFGGGGVPTGVKRSEREADYTPPTSTELKDLLSYISTLSYPFSLRNA
jgi:hypothetical protein